jgi:hypothetical protein
MPPEGQSLEPAERVRAWWERASRVYPETTKKAWLDSIEGSMIVVLSNAGELACGDSRSRRSATVRAAKRLRARDLPRAGLDGENDVVG